MESEKMTGNPILCPNCGSTQVTTVQKSYDAGLGCVGLVFFGWLGLLLGLLGGGDVELYCAHCGHRWQPPGAKSSGCASLLLLLFFIVLLFVIVIGFMPI